MIRVAILSLAFLITSVGTASAGKCGKLCDPEWWETATQEAVATEIATADVNARDEDGTTPLGWAISRGTAADITSLLKAGALLNTRNDFGFSPLHRSVAGSIASMKVLLKAGAKVDARDDSAKTPLHVAAFYGSSANIIVLLKAGADVNARDNVAQTPLHYAATQGNLAMITALLDAGANVNSRDKAAQTPLHDAAWLGTSANVIALFVRRRIKWGIRAF